MNTRKLLYTVGPVLVVVGIIVLVAQGAQKEAVQPLRSKTVSRILFADSSLGSPGPTEAIVVTVEGSAVYNPQTGYYTYSYTLSSEPSSLSDVTFFALKHMPWPVNTTAPPHWRHSRMLDSGSDSASVWQVVDAGVIPPDWVDTGNIPPSEFDLAPGQSVSGFSFVSPVPPIEDGATFIAQGFDTLPGNAESWGDDYPYPDILERGVTGLTVGPGSAVGVPSPPRGDASSSLQPARPNPSSSVVSLGYALADEAVVSLAIYDIGGRKIRSLAEGRRPSGTHSVTWNGIDDRGRPVPSGVYFYKLLVDGRSLGQRRIVLVQRSAN